MQKPHYAFVAAALLLGAGLTSAPPASAKSHKSHQSKPKTVTTKTGLKYQDVKVGTGPSPKPGQMVTVSYVGKLTNGTVFDASTNHPPGTFTFQIGAGRVIAGWDEGVMTMKVGGERILTVPPDLGYGSRDMGPIPPNSTLIFDVKLFKTQ